MVTLKKRDRRLRQIGDWSEDKSGGTLASYGWIIANAKAVTVRQRAGREKQKTRIALID